MTKVMVFIDGSWLYSNTPKLEDAEGDSDFRIDFGKLPGVLVDQLEAQSNLSDLDLVRTYFFSSYATNYDQADEDAVEKRLNFFSMLREKYHYEVKVYPVDFRGRPLRKEDRDPDDWFEPEEKCVNISLASNLLYNAGLDNSFDIALCVIGDRDYKPVLLNARQLGKRVAVASIQEGCSPQLSSSSDEANLRDFDMIWLDDLIDDIKLVYEEHKLVCESPMHEGDREVWTTYHPREGESFYCDECREKYKRKQQNNDDAAGDDDSQPDEPAPTEYDENFNTSFPENDTPGQPGNRVISDQQSDEDGDDQVRELTGFVKKKFPDRGYGFIQADDGSDYFFHLSDLMFDLTFDDVSEGKGVDFIVKKEASQEEAGAATNVRLGR